MQNDARLVQNDVRLVQNDARLVQNDACLVQNDTHTKSGHRDLHCIFWPYIFVNDTVVTWDHPAWCHQEAEKLNQVFHDNNMSDKFVLPQWQPDSTNFIVLPQVKSVVCDMYFTRIVCNHTFSGVTYCIQIQSITASLTISCGKSSRTISKVDQELFPNLMLPHIACSAVYQQTNQENNINSFVSFYSLFVYVLTHTVSPFRGAWTQ